MGELDQFTGERIETEPLEAGRRKRGGGGANVRRLRTENLTDTGNEDRFVRRCGDRAKWFTNRKQWLVYTGTHWTAQKGDMLALSMTREVVRDILADAIAAGDAERKALTEFALKCESKPKRRALLDLAATQLAVDEKEFDTDPWLFNVQNGTIDLRTGKLRPHAPGDMITKIAPFDFDPKAQAPTWTAFLDRVLGGDVELLDFVQRAAGMAMAGEVRDHAFLFLYGQGRNGKSTFLNVLLEVFGEYGRQIQADIVLKRKNDEHKTEFANLLGVRAAVMNEVPKSRTFNEGALKSLTGGDRIAARFMRGDPFDFKPTHSLFFAANNRPKVDDESDGFWRRMMLVPFEVQIPLDEIDPTLPEKLLEEAPGILRWCVDGALAWQVQGLAPPARVRNASAEYRETSDNVLTFVGDACVTRGEVSGTDLLRAYKVWCGEFSERPEGRNIFYERIERLAGVVRRSKPVVFTGLSIAVSDDR